MQKIIIEQLPSRIIQIDGEELLFFSGTSYLGVGHQAAFREALAAGIAQYGTIFSASRNNNVQLRIYEECEDFLAQSVGAEASLTVSSGLFAGQLAVQSFDFEHIFYTPSVHPAIWLKNAPNSTWLGNDFEDFTEKIASAIAQKPQQKIAICSNTTDPLYCHPTQFDWILQFIDNKYITLIFDDSHGLGVVSKSSPLFHFLAKNKIKFGDTAARIIVVASLAKAIGISGGVLFSDKKTIAQMRTIPLFVGASPIIPAYLSAFLNTQTDYAIWRKQLLDNIHYFLEKNVQNNTLSDFRFLEKYPIFYTKNSDLAHFLYENKVFISNFAYPRPTDPPITRIIISALHTPDDIDILTNLLKQ